MFIRGSAFHLSLLVFSKGLQSCLDLLTVNRGHAVNVIASMSRLWQ